MDNPFEQLNFTDNSSDDVLDNERQEDENDLSKSTQYSQAVVTSTDWTTETIISQMKKNNILLDTDYQRRDAWTNDKKSRFIESLFLGLPIPQIILAETKKKKGAYIVIDGKQRLISLRQFMSTPEDKNFKPLKLNNLVIKSEFNKKSFKDIEEAGIYYDDITAFQNQPIRTVVVKNWPNEDFLYLLFLRLNTGSVALSPQELRQALHPGEFLTFVNEFSSKSESISKMLDLSEPDFRMRDVEYVIRFFAFKNFINDYKGNMKRFLDETCVKLNKEWEEKNIVIKEQANSLNDAIDFTYKIFGKNAMKKYKNGRFENTRNRAVFDIMTYYFSNDKIRNESIIMQPDIFEQFVSLCSTDNNFVNALETTTKSQRSVFYRFITWGNALSKVLNIDIDVP